MNEDLENLHNEAMELSDQADLFRRDKDAAAARALYRQAMKKERDAAVGYRALPDAKPVSVAMLLRSAATLARDAGEAREAERLICLALSAMEIPPIIADELRDLLEEVHLARHLELRNIKLTPREVQMSLNGDAVGFGVVQSDVFLDRGEALENLLYREAERRLELPYRKGGVVVPAVRDQFGVYLSAARGGSFAVTYRVGSQEEASPDAEELKAPAAPKDARIDAVDVLQTVLDGLRLFDANREDELKFAGPYGKNFIEQARRLAPDGKQVIQVGLTTQGRNGEVNPLALRRVIQRRGRHSVPDLVDYVGRLTEIKERSNDDNTPVSIALDTRTGRKAALLRADDVARARTLFKEEVRVRAKKEKIGYVVQEIRAA